MQRHATKSTVLTESPLYTLAPSSWKSPGARRRAREAPVKRGPALPAGPLNPCPSASPPRCRSPRRGESPSRGRFRDSLRPFIRKDLAGVCLPRGGTGMTILQVLDRSRNPIERPSNSSSSPSPLFPSIAYDDRLTCLGTRAGESVISLFWEVPTRYKRSLLGPLY